MANKQEGTDYVVSITVGVRDIQLSGLDKLAAELNVNRNAVVRFSILWFLAHPPTLLVLQNLDKEITEFTGTWKSRGFTIRPSEIEYLDLMAQNTGFTKNRIMNMAILYLQKQIENKSLNMMDYLEIPEVKNHLRMPQIN